MKRFFMALVCDEDGAITADWVALSAAVLGFALFGVYLLTGVARDTSEHADGMISGYVIDENFDSIDDVLTLEDTARDTAWD